MSRSLSPRPQGVSSAARRCVGQIRRGERIARRQQCTLRRGDVGTVKAITIVSDTEVVVDMMVRRDAAAHIRLNAVASIASDGLMGNKLVSIEPLTGTSGPLIDGSVLNTLTRARYRRDAARARHLQR
ncbi:MAG: MCE family protein [Flavobacteriales bacterium]|nr:MCE family protein [Flavobacteriales bacterium]